MLTKGEGLPEIDLKNVRGWGAGGSEILHVHLKKQAQEIGLGAMLTWGGIKLKKNKKIWMQKDFSD